MGAFQPHAKPSRGGLKSSPNQNHCLLGDTPGLCPPGSVLAGVVLDSSGFLGEGALLVALAREIKEPRALIASHGCLLAQMKVLRLTKQKQTRRVISKAGGGGWGINQEAGSIRARYCMYNR